MLSCVRLFVTSWTVQSMEFSTPEYWSEVGSLSLFQGIFPIQGFNPGLPHCRRILYQLSHKGSPNINIIIYNTSIYTYVFACVFSCFSHVQLCVTPWTVDCLSPLSMGFSQQEYWNGLSCPPPEDLPNPEIKPRSPTLQPDSLASEPPGKPKNTGVGPIPSSGFIPSPGFIPNQGIELGSPALRADSLPRKIPGQIGRASCRERV